MKVTAEEIERVLRDHELNGIFTCNCGLDLRVSSALGKLSSEHHFHVAAHILKLLESKEGEGE